MGLFPGFVMFDLYLQYYHLKLLDFKNKYIYHFMLIFFKLFILFILFFINID